MTAAEGFGCSRNLHQNGAQGYKSFEVFTRNPRALRCSYLSEQHVNGDPHGNPLFTVIDWGQTEWQDLGK
jgi:hypothetical protein